MADRSRVGPIRRLLNGIMAFLIRRDWAPAGFFLLSVAGRASGENYSTPVRVISWQGDRWLVARYGDVNWVRNARASGRAQLRRGREWEEVTLVEVDSEHRAPVIQRYLEIDPLSRSALMPAAENNLESYRAAADAHPVFVILPSTPERSG